MFLLSRYFIPAATCDAMSRTFEYEIEPAFAPTPTPTPLTPSDAPLDVEVVVDVDDDDAVTAHDVDAATHECRQSTLHPAPLHPWIQARRQVQASRHLPAAEGSATLGFAKRAYEEYEKLAAATDRDGDVVVDDACNDLGVNESGDAA